MLADVGVDTTRRIMDGLRKRARKLASDDSEGLRQALRNEILEILQPVAMPLEIPREGGPFVILMVGVNGSGKTTSIGKLARRFTEQGYSVLLAAGDTYRAAATEQLQAWGAKNGVPVISQAAGADPAGRDIRRDRSRSRQANRHCARRYGRAAAESGQPDARTAKSGAGCGPARRGRAA